MSAAVDSRFGVGRVTRFYLPLLLQAFSQSLTYPLVAGIVTHGPDGVDALTAFSQGQVVMFMIGAIGGGLVTTGLVFAKTWYGYLSFRRLNALMMAVLLSAQMLVCRRSRRCRLSRTGYSRGCLRCRRTSPRLRD